MQFCKFSKSRFDTSFDFLDYKMTIELTIPRTVRLKKSILFERFGLLGLNRILKVDEVG